MRRWLWPYAILATVLSVLGIGALIVMYLGAGRAEAQLAIAQDLAIDPIRRFLVSMLEMVAPVALPDWFKDLYALLAMIALVGLVVSAVMCLLLLPVFYALYRGARNERG